jgi:carboxyl-terminal processing protease
MRSHYRAAWCLTIVGLAALTAFARPAEPRRQDQPASPPRAEAFVKSMWAVSDLVLENDIDPPTRQEMMLGGIKALLQKAGATVPTDLSRRISTLSTQEDFTALVQECWPKDNAKKAPSHEELITAMLQGMLHRVPGESKLVPTKELKVLEQIRENRYVGTGIQISMNPKENRCQIVEPFRGGPARKAGAKPGDVILEVDGKDTEGLSVLQMVDIIRGEEGTPVTFLVRQPGATETRTLKMTRGVVPFETILGIKRGADDAWMHRVHPEAPVAYVQVVSIDSSTVNDLRQAAQKLEAAGFRALVLDLRETRGDAVQPAALLADSLLDEGVLWQVRDAKQRVKEYRADRDCLFRDWPMAVLINESSGPAAGWVAQALRNNQRAILVGGEAKDRHLVTTLVHLPDGKGAISVRTGVVEFPNPRPAGKTEEGDAAQQIIKVDHVVKVSAKQKEDLTKWFFAKNVSRLPQGVSDEPPDDPQLAKAVKLVQEALAKAAKDGKTEAPGGKRK